MAHLPFLIRVALRFLVIPVPGTSGDFAALAVPPAPMALARLAILVSSPQLPAHAPLNSLSNSPRCSFCLERNLDFSGWKLNKSPRTEESVGQQKQASKITVSKAW